MASNVAENIAQSSFSSLQFPNLTASFSPFGDYLLLLMIISLATMAILQVLKAIGLRAIIYRLMLKRWIRTAESDALRKLGEISLDDDVVSIYLAEFEHDLSKGVFLERLHNMALPSSSKWMFYRLPLEQMVGQINAAIQPIIDTPVRRDWSLLFTLSQDVGIDMFLAAYGPKEFQDEYARSLGKEDHMDVDSLGAEAANRVHAQVQRSLDSMQIVVGSRWRFIQTSVSAFLGIGFSLAAAFASSGNLQAWPLWAVTGLIAVVMAPIFRDIAFAIRHLARPNE